MFHVKDNVEWSSSEVWTGHHQNWIVSLTSLYHGCGAKSDTGILGEGNFGDIERRKMCHNNQCHRMMEILEDAEMLYEYSIRVVRLFRMTMMQSEVLQHWMIWHDLGNHVVV